MAVDESPADHRPVMVEDVVAMCRQYQPRVLVDGTVGLGGHAEAILTACPGLTAYLGIDRDPEALERAGRRLERFGERVRLERATFDQCPGILARLGFEGVDGVLLDLGVSSYQLESAHRGFSFARPGPIDMRMGLDEGPTALDLIRRLPESELARVLRAFGEVDAPRRVARAIKVCEDSLETTEDLARVVTRATPGRVRSRLRIHPATKVFQALRIAVNRELELLGEALPAWLERLAPGGFFLVISFHSLEDRIVKRFFQEQARGCVCPPVFPRCICGRRPTLELVHRRALRPSAEEVARNPRSRSARLRVACKLPASTDEAPGGPR